MLKTLKHLLRHPLNRNHRMAAVSRFLRWQIANRILPVPYLMPFVDDTVLVMERGMTGATGNWYSGLHEEAEMAFVLHLLRAGDFFADIGANVGAYTVLAAGAVGARCISFEPIYDSFFNLKRNVRANRIDRLVTCHNVGLGEREEILCFTSSQDTTNHVADEADVRAGEVIDVPVRRLDAVLAGEVPTLIKIDVEGWEAHVLAGMQLTLADPRLKAVISETNQSAQRYIDSGIAQVFDIMTGCGFEPYSYNAIKRRLVAGVGAHNTIFVRDLDFIQNRVLQAPRFETVTGSI